MKFTNMNSNLQTNEEDLSLLRRSDVIDIVGLSKSTIWRLEQSRKFPRSVQLTHRSVAYRKREIYEWLQNPMGYEVIN